MSTALSPLVNAAMERLANRWPAQNQRPRTDVPDWVASWINFAFTLQRNELDNVNAFAQVPAVNAGVRQLMDDVASIPIRVYKGRGDQRVEIERAGKEVDEGGNLADLLAYANPIDTGRLVRGETIGSRIVTGNGYWFLSKLRGPNRPPNWIWDLPGQDMKVVPGKGRTIAGYEFTGNWSGPWEPLNEANVVHFRNFNLKDEPTGISDLEAVKQSYQIQYYALLWLKQFFLKGGILAGVWKVSDEKLTRMNDEQARALKEKLQREHVGWSNLGQAVVVQGIEFVQSGMTLKDMEIERQIAIAEANIFRALGIPPVMMGIKDGGGLSDAGASTDLANYWLGRINQLCSHFDDVINEKVAPLFGDDISVESDISNVLPVQNARLEQAKTHQALTGGEAIETVNEARKAMGQAARPEPEYDELYKRPIAGLMPDGTPMPRPGLEDEAPPKKVKRQRRMIAEPEDPRAELRAGAREGIARWQGRFEAFVLERLREQKSTVLSRLKKFESFGQNGHARLAIDIESLIDDPNEDDLQRARLMLERLLRERGIDALQDLERVAGVALEVELDLTLDRVAEFVAKQVERAIDVPDRTTARMLREHLAEVVTEGGGLAELRKAVDEVFESRRNNAMTIARTETLPAYNFGAMEAWRQSEVVDKHYWLTSRSGLGGRHSEDPDGHYALSDNGLGLDGQVRALGEEFDCGGVPMLYPGDPNGPAGECLNCVCVTVALFDEARLSLRRVRGALRPVTNAHAGRNGHPTNRLREYLQGVK